VRASRLLARILRPASRGQALVELALVVPILLLLFAAAADLGRAFYAYVALENAVKEGAVFGARHPACFDQYGGFGCAGANNVISRVQDELQGLRNPDGTLVAPTAQCFAPSAPTTPVALTDCDEGYAYTVRATHNFRLITPILGSILGDGLTLRSTATATVLNAGDPTPGASVQKYVDPTGALNETEIRDKCIDPNDQAAGFYRSPCSDLSATATAGDRLFIRFDSGAAISYKVVVANSGILDLTNVVITDTVDGVVGYLPNTCPTQPTSLPIGAPQYECTYSQNAPAVPGSALSFEHTNVLTVNANPILPTTDYVTVVVEKPAELEAYKYVSPYRLGGDGDGEPSFGTAQSIVVGLNDLVADESVWYRLIVRNVGGKTATGVSITDTAGPIPFGQSGCDPQPTEIQPGVGAAWQCWYRVPITTPGTTSNTLRVTADNDAADPNDVATATVTATACTGNDRVIPNVIGGTKLEAETAWLDAGMTGNLTTWAANDSDPVMTQSVRAFSCTGRNTSMTVTRVVTP
jgi:uncharacterized repeat protein (TIGR01451 family)